MLYSDYNVPIRSAAAMLWFLWSTQADSEVPLQGLQANRCDSKLLVAAIESFLSNASHQVDY